MTTLGLSSNNNKLLRVRVVIKSQGKVNVYKIFFAVEQFMLSHSETVVISPIEYINK